MSIVEDTLRSQRETWKEISERISKVFSRELPFANQSPKRILLFGVGSSYHAAKLTAFALHRDRSKPRIPIFSCQSTGIGTEIFPTKGDWAFGFSHRGRTPVTLKALGDCDRAGAFTLLVRGQSSVEMDLETAKATIETSPLEKCEPHTMAVTGAICAVTSLMIGEKAIEEWDALRSLGDPNLDSLREIAGQGPSALLGEWEGEWIAREGALKLMEMARISVRAYGSEEFFHGPRHVLSGKKEILWHIAHPDDQRSDEVSAKHKVLITGHTPLAFVPALVETQWLSLATALNLGKDPDLKI